MAMAAWAGVPMSAMTLFEEAENLLRDHIERCRSNFPASGCKRYGDSVKPCPEAVDMVLKIWTVWRDPDSHVARP